MSSSGVRCGSSARTPRFALALVAPVTARLAVLLGAAVNELAARFAQPIQRRTGAVRNVAQQALQARSVLCCYAHAGVYRKPTVFVPQHLLGLEAFEQAPATKARRMLPTQTGLGLGHRFGVDADSQVET